MKVGAWHEERRDGVLRLSVTITWEDRERANDVVWFEWPDDLADRIRAEPDAALLATYALAMSHGERRLVVDGDVSPRLSDGVRSAMAIVAEMHPSLHPVTLELSERPAAPVPTPPERHAALCFSGGVDALAALQENLRTTPPDHPERYREGLFVFGLNTFDIVDGVHAHDRLAANLAHRARLAAFLDGVGMTLATGTTNVRSLFPGFEQWWASANNSALAAFGHLIRMRVHSLGLGSSGSGVMANVTPHPNIDWLHSSHNFSVVPVHVMTTRLEKLRRLSLWPEAMGLLRVCLMIDLPESGQVNCGRCEKCIRTMLQLIVIGDGALARANFAVGDVSAEAVDRALLGMPNWTSYYYPELAPLLAAQGRHDLALAIQRGNARVTQGTEGVTPRRSWWRRA